MADQRFSQSQSLQQQQTIAPQMQQSLELLQSPTLELRHMVQRELDINPVLDDETEEISLEETAQENHDEDFDKEFAELSQMDQEWRDYLKESRASNQRSDADERHQFMMDSLVETQTLQEHLLEQLSVADVETDQRKLVELLIGNIDDNGFLQLDLEDFAMDMAIPFDDLERAQLLIQTFEPKGVGASDLRECLLIQLDQNGKHHSLEYRIIDKYLDDLAKHRFPQIAKKTGVAVDQISAAAEAIARLDPKPGSDYTTGTNAYVTPDVIVEQVGDEWKVQMVNEQIPRLRISNSYKDLMAQSGSGGKGEVREYIREKIRAGKFLIRSIHQRQQTIENIANQIVKRQVDFFEHGASKLHPMNMAQIAEIVEVHETTVSRAVSGKYMKTPWGVFEMKYFFTTGYETESGETMSNTSVKKALAEIVAEEDHKKPLSDAALAKKLEEKGLKIARRTVAKYRDELHILPSHMRKQY